MRNKIFVILILILLVVSVSACRGDFLQRETSVSTESLYATSTETSDVPMIPVNPSSEEETHKETEESHSPLYIDGLDVAEVIRYFNEVCLDAEIINSGDANLLQKWTDPICFSVHGAPTDQDLEVIHSFTAWLNTMEGFPGIYKAQDGQDANLQIYFCTQQEMFTRMGEGFTDMDGAVTYWYMDNAIYSAIICCRTDLSQNLRNSVILEEIYNGLGPIQDTQLRADSIVYSEYSEQQSLTDVDELILKITYHPLLQCGMDADECETVIRDLYW